MNSVGLRDALDDGADAGNVLITVIYRSLLSGKISRNIRVTALCTVAIHSIRNDVAYRGLPVDP